MATHELVVPKSIPITSPASAPEDSHRADERGLSAVAAGDADKVEERPSEDESPLRSPSCKAMLLLLYCLLVVKTSRVVVSNGEDWSRSSKDIARG